jgi:hypothetical protein
VTAAARGGAAGSSKLLSDDADSAAAAPRPVVRSAPSQGRALYLLRPLLFSRFRDQREAARRAIVVITDGIVTDPLARALRASELLDREPGYSGRTPRDWLDLKP